MPGTAGDESDQPTAPPPAPDAGEQAGAPSLRYEPPEPPEPQEPPEPAEPTEPAPPSNSASTASSGTSGPSIQNFGEPAPSGGDSSASGGKKSAGGSGETAGGSSGASAQSGDGGKNGAASGRAPAVQGDGAETGSPSATAAAAGDGGEPGGPPGAAEPQSADASEPGAPASTASPQGADGGEPGAPSAGQPQSGEAGEAAGPTSNTGGEVGEPAADEAESKLDPLGETVNVTASADVSEPPPKAGTVPVGGDSGDTYIVVDNEIVGQVSGNGANTWGEVEVHRNWNGKKWEIEVTIPPGATFQDMRGAAAANKYEMTTSQAPTKAEREEAKRDYEAGRQPSSKHNAAGHAPPQHGAKPGAPGTGHPQHQGEKPGSKPAPSGGGRGEHATPKHDGADLAKPKPKGADAAPPAAKGGDGHHGAKPKEARQEDPKHAPQKSDQTRPATKGSDGSNPARKNESEKPPTRSSEAKRPPAKGGAERPPAKPNETPPQPKNGGDAGTPKAKGGDAPTPPKGAADAKPPRGEAKPSVAPGGERSEPEPPTGDGGHPKPANPQDAQQKGKPAPGGEDRSQDGRPAALGEQGGEHAPGGRGVVRSGGSTTAAEGGHGDVKTDEAPKTELDYTTLFGQLLSPFGVESMLSLFGKPDKEVISGGVPEGVGSPDNASPLAQAGILGVNSIFAFLDSAIKIGKAAIIRIKPSNAIEDVVAFEARQAAFEAGRDVKAGGSNAIARRQGKDLPTPTGEQLSKISADTKQGARLRKAYSRTQGQVAGDYLQSNLRSRSDAFAGFNSDPHFGEASGRLVPEVGFKDGTTIHIDKYPGGSPKGSRTLDIGVTSQSIAPVDWPSLKGTPGGTAFSDGFDLKVGEGMIKNKPGFTTQSGIVPQEVRPFTPGLEQK